MLTYDFIIIGAGPTGIALAWYLQRFGLSVIIIERESEIGGCHRVRRENGLFTEHGPRIYVDNYLHFRTMLDDMFQGSEVFYDLFTQYKFGKTDLLKYLQKFTFTELFTLFFSFLRLMIDNDFGKRTILKDYLVENNFSTETQDYLNRICILTDGAQSDRYTLNKFLQILNQNALYNIYQPRASNDLLLWKWIKRALIKSGRVTILLETNVQQVLDNGKLAIGIKTDKDKIYLARNVLAALPPESLLPILKKSSPLIRNAFGNYNKLKRWAHYTKYDTYIPIMFYFPKSKLDQVWGIPTSDWGVASIVLSDYMEDLANQGTVISTCLSLLDNQSSKTGKTANQTKDQDELIKETLRQLKEIYNNQLPEPIKTIISPEIYYQDDRYRSIDSAYFQTILDPMSPSNVNNFHNIGCQNGNSQYAFTSLEGAVENAVVFLRERSPILVKDVLPSRLWTIRTLLTILLLVTLVCITLYLTIRIITKSYIGVGESHQNYIWSKDSI